MPANSGAITGTVAHKHSSLGSDGGFLDDGVTGVTGTSNGSLLYADGSSVLQDLPAGNLNDVLTQTATIPSWQASSGGGVWNSLYSEFNTTGSLDTGFQASWAAYRYLNIYLSSQTTSTDAVEMRIYDPDGNEYSESSYYTFGHRLALGPDSDDFLFSATTEMSLTGGYGQYTNTQWSLFLQLQMLSPNSWAGENAITGYFSNMTRGTCVNGTIAIQRDNVTSTDSQLVQGLKLISPSTNQTGVFCQVFGAGDSTA